MTTKGVDEVSEAATDDDVVTVTGIDVVNATGRSCGKAHDQVDVGGIQIRTRNTWITFGSDVVDKAIVTEDDIVAFTDVNGITALATDDQVVAATSGDGVIVAVVRRCRLRRFQHSTALGVFDLPVVAEHHVVAVTGCHPVLPEAAHNHVVAGSGGDGLVSALTGLSGSDKVQFTAMEQDLTVVAQHDIVAVSGIDCLGRACVRVVESTENHIISGTRGDSVVTAAVGWEGRADFIQDRDVIVGSVKDRFPVVTNYHVAVIATDDSVSVGSTQHRIAAIPDTDCVRSANRGISRRDESQSSICIKDRPAVVTDHHVAIGSAGDCVATGSTQDGVAAVARKDVIEFTQCRIAQVGFEGVVCGCRDEDHRSGCVEDSPSVVPEDDIVAFSRAQWQQGGLVDIDVIGAEASDHGVRSGTDIDHVIVSEGRVDSGDGGEDAFSGHTIEAGPPVVTDDHVTVGPAGDRVPTIATQHDVYPFTYSNHVVVIPMTRGRHCSIA